MAKQTLTYFEFDNMWQQMSEDEKAVVQKYADLNSCGLWMSVEECPSLVPARLRREAAKDCGE